MAFQGDSIFWVEVGKIVPNPYQPRREFNEDKLRELAESVRMYGILQPLTVTRKEIQLEDGAFRNEYELIAGERRLRASRLAGLAQVPVIIRDSDDSEQEKLELAIIENLQREDLNAVDRALAFQQLASAFNLTHEQVAKKVGRSRMYVSNTIRLLGLPDVILEALKKGDVNEGHARTLLMLKDRPEEQDVVFREIMLKKLSVRDVEQIVRKIATDKVRKKNWKGSDPRLIEIEKKFTVALGTRVQIAKTDYGGKVTIDYFSEEDLQKLLSSLDKKNEPEVNETEVESSEESTVVRTMEEMGHSTPLEIVDESPELEEVSDEIDEEANSFVDNTTHPPELKINEEDTNNRYSQVEQSVSETAANEEVTEENDESTDLSSILSEEKLSLEEQILNAAREAGSQAYRPNTEEKIENSVATRNEVERQINNLHEREKQYTPPANPQAMFNKTEVVAKDAEEEDLYSMKNFSI